MFGAPKTPSPPPPPPPPPNPPTYAAAQTPTSTMSNAGSAAGIGSTILTSALGSDPSTPGRKTLLGT